jgi:hypothetical protein
MLVCSTILALSKLPVDRDEPDPPKLGGACEEPGRRTSFQKEVAGTAGARRALEPNKLWR